MNYIQYMKPGGNFWVLPNGLEDVSWSEFWNNWKQAIEKAKDLIIDKWENLKQDYKDAADPIAASERRQAESIEATRAKQASMKFVSDNRTDHEKKRDRRNFELKEFEQKRQLNKEAADAVMWTLTGPVYAVQHLSSPNGVVKTYGNTKAAVQSGGGPYIEKAVASAAGDVLDASIVGVPLWNAARPYAAGLYNTTNYSSLGNRLAHPIESLRFAKINTKLSDLVRQAYPEETAKLMLEEAAPLFKTVRYYNKGTSGPLYIGGTDIPLLIEGLRNTPTTTVKMWDRAHEYGHLFDDALRRLDTGMARGNFGLSKEGISLVPKNYTYSPGVGINTPRGQMEFMADNIASSLYPEAKHVGMLHGEVAPYLKRLELAAQVPFSSMYVLNGSTHVPYFLPEYKNFGRFIPISAQRGSLGKGYKSTTQDDHSILTAFERKQSLLSEAERLGIPKGERNAYLIGTNADPSYYTAIGLNNSRYTQRLRDFHFELSFPGIERTTVYHGNMIPDNMMQLRGLNPYFDGGRLFGYFSSSSRPIAKTYNFVNGASTHSLYPIIKKPYVLQANGRNGIEVATNKFNLVVKTDQVVKQAFDAGHDGVIIKNVVDIGPIRANLKNASEVADDIITLPGKAKMTDAVTYDDLYQIIPLSQRDNILIHDIRYKQGGSIHIKKENKGKFTDYCGGKVTEECIRKGKNSSNPTTRKRANFAANARKWKHEEGGKINYLNYFK